VAPAMNDLMYTHLKTQDHLKALRARRTVVVEPGTGRLASGKSGVGRLAAPERIVAAIEADLADRRNLEGLRMVVSAGGTREPVGPVLYGGNCYSGEP